MSEAEVAAFLGEERTVTCATVGPRGWPHLMPLWYVLREPPAGERGPRVWAWTYASSQKVRNLERDPRASVQVEAAEQYQNVVDLTVREPRHRLVGDQQLRLRRHGPRELELAHLDLGQFARQPVRLALEPDLAQQLDAARRDIGPVMRGAA